MAIPKALMTASRSPKPGDAHLLGGPKARHAVRMSKSNIGSSAENL
jgi:hypothetical protein